MMKKWLILMGLLCFMPHMLYADECNSIVWDQANKLSPEVKKVAVEFEKRFEATVRMQTIRDFGGYLSFDAYVQHLKDACVVWKPANNGKLISLIVSFGKRDLGIYYGDFWKSELDPYHNQIRENKVKPLLRSGNFDGAFITALNEIGEVLDAPAPVVHVTQTDAVRDARPSQPTVVVQKEATDMSGLWIVLKLFLFAGIFSGIGTAIVMFFRNKKREREARSAAQRKAQSVKVRCSNLINELKIPISRSKSMLSSLRESVDPDDVAVAVELFVFVERTYAQVSATYADMPSKMDPDTEDLSVQEYATIAQTYGEILESLSDIRAKNNTIAQQVAELKQRINEAPERISTVDQFINSVSTEIDDIEKTGFIVTLMRARMENAKDLLSQAKTALNERSYGDVFTLCDNAETEATTASLNATHLPELSAGLADQFGSIESDLDEMRQTIDFAKEIFLDIKEEYRASSWMSIRGNGTEAENAAISAMQIVQEARIFASMDNQQWEQAQDRIDQARALIEKAHSLVQSIISLRDNLEKAKVSVDIEIADAIVDIKKADEYMTMYDSDIDDVWWDELDKAREDVQTAQIILRDAKPDYIHALHLAISANKSADHILDQAEDEHETMVRKRKRLASARIIAEQSLSVAEEYLQDHRSDISSRARNEIRDARKRFDGTYTSANDVVNISKAITRMENVSNVADSALDIAQNDVSDAQSSISGGSSDWGTSISSIGGSSGGGWSGGGISGLSSGGWSGGGISGGSSGGW